MDKEHLFQLLEHTPWDLLVLLVSLRPLDLIKDIACHY